MSYIIKGATAEWEVVIGLEVHCQIVSLSKLFSPSSAEFGGAPNSHVSFIDAGYPGVLPRANEFCIEQALKTSLALNGTINKVSYFDRKHYFYPDLPFGYQITQFYKPIMEEGHLIINLDDGTSKIIGIERLHIEQDAGKLLHDHHASKSLIDLNRAGVGLMEIVSKPELTSPQEVSAYLNKLRTIVRYIESCDGNMEEGSMRCDINISVRHVGETNKRTRVEVKNVNSIRFVMQAIEYEVKRQIEVWERGEAVFQETRLFDANKGVTFSLRSKEEAADYRYIRDPDLLPLVIDDAYISEISSKLPELPDQKVERFISSYGLSKYDAEVLTREKEIANYFENVLNNKEVECNNARIVSNWVTTNLFAFLNKENLSIEQSKVSADNLAKLIALLETEVISSKIAKEVFEIMWKEPNKTPEQIVEEKGLQQITNETEIAKVIDDIISNNLSKVEEIRSGKDKLLGWFVGETMKITKGKANPEMVNKLLKKKIYL
ncbi:Asp-tRNA(Asn)/Glu-tRNA(Gln) amidotransferase subunit GatB [Rickettsiales bacterium LUAb2]